MRAALAKKDGDGALRVLQRNTDREAMYALRVAYGPSFGSDLRSRLSATQFARARGFAGDQIALDAQLEGEDAERTLATLERMSDAEAYALMLDKDQPNAIALPDPGPVAAHAKLVDLQAAMRRQLKPDDYYRAMRMVLDKAQRVAAHVDPKDLGARFVRGAASTERVDLAEERVRAAESKPGSKAEVDAYLAIADFDASQRQALAKRLHAKPLRDRPLPPAVG